MANKRRPGAESEDIELKEAMVGLSLQRLKATPPKNSDSSPGTPKRRGRRKAGAKTPAAGPAAPVGQPATINAETLAEDMETDLKTEMTLKELRFLELHASGEHTVEDSMKLAGYEGYHQSYLYKLARKIIQKYEQGAGDARKIMRAVGVGEVAVALKIKELMNDPSKTIQAKGVELAGKYLGMSKETLQVEHGITIVIKGSGQSSAPSGGPQSRPQAEKHKALPGPVPIEIIK